MDVMEMLVDSNGRKIWCWKTFFVTANTQIRYVGNNCITQRYCSGWIKGLVYHTHPYSFEDNANKRIYTVHTLAGWAYTLIYVRSCMPWIYVHAVLLFIFHYNVPIFGKLPQMIESVHCSNPRELTGWFGGLNGGLTIFSKSVSGSCHIVQGRWRC